MLVKYSKTRIQQVFKDLNDLKSFVKTAGKNTQRHLENKLAALPIIKTDPEKYTLLRNRSISCMELYGPNQNADAFPEKELKEKYSTFKDCRITVDHIYNDNPDNIIGIVLSSIYVEPQIYIPSENKLEPYDEDKVKKYADLGKGMKLVGGYIENLLAIDNERAEKHTPGIVEAIKNGEITDTSMGCSVTLSICSVCGNEAETEEQFCNHIKHHKGEIVTFAGKDKLAYEINEGIEFFEDTIVISEKFAEQSGKKAQAGGEGADQNAKVLEVLSKKEPSITDFVKKSSYFGYSDDYVIIGEKPEKYKEKMEKLVEEEENEHNDHESKKLIINDRVVKTSRLLGAMKTSKNYNEFESQVSGIIGDELTTVSRIKCKSFYNNQIKKSNKQDLLALVMGYEKQNYAMDQIKRKLSELDYSKQDIADALHAYQTAKDGYSKQANFSQLEDTNQMMNAYNTNLEDEGEGIKKDDVGQKPVVENPLFTKISNMKTILSYNPDYVTDNAKEFPDEEKEETIIKYNDDEDKVKALRKKLLALHDDDDFIEDYDEDEDENEDDEFQDEIDFSEMNPIDEDEDEDEFFEIDEKNKKKLYRPTDEYGEKYDDKGKKIDRRKIKNEETLDLGLDWDNLDDWITETFNDKIKAGKSIARAYFELKDMFRIESGRYLTLLQDLVVAEIRKKNKMENTTDDFIELDDKISKLRKNLRAGVNTKDHLKQNDTLANGAGLERYDSIINKKERDFKSNKNVDLKNYKDYRYQDSRYLTEPNGVLKKLKDLKSSLNAEIETKLKSQQERKDQFAFEYANDNDILDDSEIKGDIEIDKKFSVKDIYRKLSEVMVPTQLQPGSTVTVKDKTTNTPEEQGTITNVKEQVTNDNKQETIIEMSDGKAYSTEDFNIDKTGMIQAIEDIDYDDDQSDDKLNKIAIINDDSIDYDMVTPIEISDSDSKSLDEMFTDDYEDSDLKKTAIKEEKEFKPLRIYSGNIKGTTEFSLENEIFWKD